MDRREKEKKKRRMNDATETAKQSKSESGRTSLNIPDGVQMMQFKKAGLYWLDVVPYVLKSVGVNPHTENLEAGDMHWERIYWVHYIQTVEGGRYYCCLKYNWKKKCPICEYRDKLATRPDFDKKLVYSLKPKKRQLFNVLSYTEEGEDLVRDKKIKILECSHFVFGDTLEEVLAKSHKKEGYGRFANPDNGLTLKLTVSDTAMGDGGTFLKVKNVEFKQRDYPVSDDMVDNAPCLDDLPKEMTYAQLRRVLDQDEEPEETPEEDTSTPEFQDESLRPKKETPNGEVKVPSWLTVGTVVNYTGDICTVVKIKRDEDGVKVDLTDEYNEHHIGVDLSKVKQLVNHTPDSRTSEVSKKEKPVEKSPPTQKVKGKESMFDDEEDYDEDEDLDEDEDEDEDPAPRKSRK